MPVPANAPVPPSQHPTLGVPSTTWAYRNTAGELLGFIYRFEQKDGAKSFRPLCLFQQGDALTWRWEMWPAPRPLYGLERLAANPDEPVLVAEGEKSADAAQVLLPQFVCMTSPGGSKSAAKADWSTLKGRTVILWPDADEPGQTYAETVARLLKEAGVELVSVLVPPGDVPAGWDAADAVEDGWTAEQALDLVKAATSVAGNTKAKEPDKQKSEEAHTGKRKALKQRDALLAALEGAELWHSPEKTAYATIEVNGHKEHLRIESAAFQRWAIGRFYKATGGAAAGQLLTDVLRVLSVRAIEDGPCHQAMMRTGWADDASWLDLCDDGWRAIKITAHGWEVITDPPVKFIRSETMLAFPEPEHGYLIEEFRQFVNAEDDDYRLIVAWLVAVLWGRASAYPVLALGGEQGSGKTMITRFIRTLVDPTDVPVLTEPRNSKDLVVQSKCGLVLSFDNVSSVESWFSDAICRLATGSNIMMRKLHTDAEPFWFRGARPVLLNGIPSLTDRADLADRAVTVRLLQIDEANRQSEDDLWQQWNEVLPGILGALLDAMSSAVRRYDETKVENPPRMADFARLVIACEPGLGWEAGDFMKAYNANRQTTSEAVFEGDPVAVAIEKFIKTQHPTNGWEGTATELLAELNLIIADDMRRSRFWPAKPNALGNAVDRAAPLLRHKGIHVTRQKTAEKRLIILKLVQS
ncbi:Superfamily II helicase [Roseibium album]|nr:Superfamily II helicase [Roseibium album]